MRHRLRLAGIALAITALVGSGVTAAPAHADTSATPIVAVNASDPSAVSCFDPVTFISGICLYASQDMGSGAYTGCLFFNADGTIQPITRSTNISTLRHCWNS